MTKLPRVSADKVVKALRRAGFQTVRQRGSHVILEHVDGRITSVPIHKGEDIGVGLLRKILRDAELTLEEFQNLI